MTPSQEMELLLAEAERQTTQQEMELLLKEADRQTMSDTCPSCGQGKDHAGWMLCLDARVFQREEDMIDEKKKEAEPKLLGSRDSRQRSGEVRHPEGETGRSKDRTALGKVPQTRKGRTVSMSSNQRKSTMSKSARSLLPKPRYIELLLLLVSFGLGALPYIGIGLRSTAHLMVRGLVGAGRGTFALLRLLAQGVVEAGRGILRLLSLLVRSVVAAGKGILGLLSLLVRSVVAAGEGILGLLQAMIRGVLSAVQRILGLLQLLTRGVLKISRRVLGLVERLVRPTSWVLGIVLQWTIRVGRRVQELLELIGEVTSRMLPARRAAAEAIGVIASEGGPQVTNQVASEATVLITSGVDQDLSFQVGGQPVTIGWGENCAIRLPAAPGFAAEHARLWWRDGQRMLHHLAPGQETIVAGKQIIWTSLQDGDEASIGPYSIRISTAPAGVSS